MLTGRGRLNTFLELKMENERLQQRAEQLRAQMQALDNPSENFFTTSDNFGAAGGARSGYDMGGAAVGAEDDDGPRKKVKRLAAEQHVCVTCGRTDSPEWRKVRVAIHSPGLLCFIRRVAGSNGSEDALQRVRAAVGEEGTQGRRGG